MPESATERTTRAKANFLDRHRHATVRELRNQFDEFTREASPHDLMAMSLILYRHEAIGHGEESALVLAIGQIFGGDQEEAAAAHA